MSEFKTYDFGLAQVKPEGGTVNADPTGGFPVDKHLKNTTPNHKRVKHLMAKRGRSLFFDLAKEEFEAKISEVEQATREAAREYEEAAILDAMFDVEREH